MPTKVGDVICGDLVRDNISLAEGIVTSLEEWKQGYYRINIQPQLKTDGDKNVIPAKKFSIDIEDISILKKGAVKPTMPTYEGKEYDFGDAVQEPHSGYKGHVMVKTVSISGCLGIGIEKPGQDKDGKPWTAMIFHINEIIPWNDVPEGVVTPTPRPEKKQRTGMKESGNYIR